MRLNLKEYTDPDEVTKRVENFFSCLAYLRYCDQGDWGASGEAEVEQQMHEEADWLEENVPWMAAAIYREVLPPVTVMIVEL